MSIGRVRELWRHRATGEIYLVELEGERVVSAGGPLTEDQVSEGALEYKQAAHGRTPAYDADAVELDRRRNEYHRERLAAGAAQAGVAAGGSSASTSLRAVRCWCGELVVADDDEGLVRELRAHTDEEHPEETRTDAELRERVASEAAEPPDRPPWAY